MNKLKTFLGILCLLVCNTLFAQTTEPESSSTSSDSASRMPEFSWDSLPLYIHVRKDKKFTEEELQYLAGFPLITLEKRTGSESYGSTDAGSVEAAKAIKQINPNAKVLFYRNVPVSYTHLTLPTICSV